MATPSPVPPSPVPVGLGEQSTGNAYAEGSVIFRGTPNAVIDLTFRTFVR